MPSGYFDAVSNFLQLIAIWTAIHFQINIAKYLISTLLSS